MYGLFFASSSLIEQSDVPVTDGVDGNIVGRDPGLLPLGNNGGPTLTQSLLPSSPALNSGDDTDAPETDQRGFDRIRLGRIDMGAVEVQQIYVPPPPPVADEPPCDGASAAGFTDVSSDNVHGAAIDCLAALGITEGGPDGLPTDQYGPSLDVTRGQMASFLARLVVAAGVELPSAPADAFGDDDGTTHEADINALAAAGIVDGYDDGTYGPGDPVRRDQMASFLLRTHDYISDNTLPAGADAFDDDEPGNVHEAAINALAAAGVIEGTATPRVYDPSGNVRRDQMASFLTRLAGLLASEDDFPVNP